MAGLLLSLCGAPDGRMRSAHARSKRPDLMRARKVSTACPPGMRHRMPERFSLCVTRVLQAASTPAFARAGSEPMVRPCSFMSWISHALAVFSEEGEFALDFGAVPFCPVAEVAQRPDHLGDALGIVTQDMAVCLEPAGVYRMVGGCPEMLAGVPEIDDLGLWREGLKEGPVVCGAVSDGGDGAPGAQSADLRDLACELRLQRELAAFGHAAEIEGLQPLALAVVEGDRAAGGLAPAGFGAPGLAGPQRHHDAVERDGGAHRVLRDVAGVPDGGRRLRAEVLPALMHAPGEAQQGAR